MKEASKQQSIHVSVRPHLATQRGKKLFKCTSIVKGEAEFKELENLQTSHIELKGITLKKPTMCTEGLGLHF